MGSNAERVNEVSPGLVRGYTITLGVFAAIFFLGSISIYSSADGPTAEPLARWALVLAARIGLAVGFICAFVAFLRARRSEFAFGATAAFNVLLFLYFPLGTIASLFWWFKIRNREKPGHAAY